MAYRYRDQHSRLSGERFIRCDEAHNRPYGRRSLQLWCVRACVRACVRVRVRVRARAYGDVMTVVIVVLVVYVYLYVCCGVWG